MVAVELLSPANGASVSLYTDISREFIRRERVDIPKSTDDYAWLDDFRKTGRRTGEPATLLFRWRCDQPSVTTFELSLNEDFFPCERLGEIATLGLVCASAETENEYFLCADNLLSNTTYYWRVNGCPARTFTTADDVRFIRIDGGGNIRDLGGRCTTDGRRIKQGCIYRGGSLDSPPPWYCLTERGRLEMKTSLGIRTEIDLRGDAFGTLEKSPVGDEVFFLFLPISAYSSVFSPTIREEYLRPKPEYRCEVEGFAAFRQMFDLFADETAYPIYFHCTAGADRTGTVAMLLGAVLGLSEDDLRLDYDLTSLVDPRNWYDECPLKFRDELNERYPDRPLSEQLVSLLSDMGIAKETLVRIRENLLE